MDFFNGCGFLIPIVNILHFVLLYMKNLTSWKQLFHTISEIIHAAKYISNSNTPLHGRGAEYLSLKTFEMKIMPVVQHSTIKFARESSQKQYCMLIAEVNKLTLLLLSSISRIHLLEVVSTKKTNSWKLVSKCYIKSRDINIIGKLK